MTAPGGQRREAGAHEAGERLAERFCDALVAVRGNARRCGSVDEARAHVRDLCGRGRVVIDDHADLDGLAAGLTVVDDPWQADVGVTGVTAAIAATGTLVQLAGAGTPRSTSLVPPVHVALVPLSRLVASVDDAVALLDALDPKPSAMQFVTGPSNSGDIALTRVWGVHGPGEVHALLYPDR